MAAVAEQRSRGGAEKASSGPKEAGEGVREKLERRGDEGEGECVREKRKEEMRKLGDT
jgi:hypothetical protein